MSSSSYFPISANMSLNLSLPQNLATQPPKKNVSKPAQTQVTSTEILADAHDIKQANFKNPSLGIQDLDELRLFQLAKRRDYEQQLNKNRLNYGQWMRYAKWEIDHNHDFKRGRSIMERALEVNVQHVPFWVRYIELELLHRNVNHARNLLHRAVSTLPRTDKFWFMYVQAEETLGNFNGVRGVFEKWLSWKPSEPAWNSYVLFEERYAEYDNARAIFARYVTEFPKGETWNRWLVFETTLLFETTLPASESTQIARIRGVFETAVDTLLGSERTGSDASISGIFLRWIHWEASVGEPERARAILAAVIDQKMLLKGQKLEVLESSSSMQEHNITTALVGVPAVESSDLALRLKRKFKLEKAVAENARDYDSWWEYACVQETSLGPKYAMEILAKAVETCPEDAYKLTLWRRYVFLWVKLALYAEYAAQDVLHARTIWTKCLLIIPHETFTFAKIWIAYAEFEVRNGDGVPLARKILGKAIGSCCKDMPKPKLFKYYTGLEKRLGELERVRKIYEKWLEICLICEKQSIHTSKPSSTTILQEYIDFEKSLGESERCIALFDMGISGDFSENPRFFHEYIDFLKEELRYESARKVFRNSLATSDSADTWIAFALFESSILSPAQMEDLEKAESDEVLFSLETYHVQRTSALFSEAYTHYRSLKDGASATLIVEAWLEYERMHGTSQEAQKVETKRPNRIKKRRTVDGIEEVYLEYEFPDTAPNVSKFLANAKQWASAVRKG